MAHCDAVPVNGSSRIKSSGAPPRRMTPNGWLENPELVSLPILTQTSSWMAPRADSTSIPRQFSQSIRVVAGLPTEPLVTTAGLHRIEVFARFAPDDTIRNRKSIDVSMPALLRDAGVPPVPSIPRQFSAALRRFLKLFPSSPRIRARARIDALGIARRIGFVIRMRCVFESHWSPDDVKAPASASSNVSRNVPQF
jgi:hypothetical protein